MLKKVGFPKIRFLILEDFMSGNNFLPFPSGSPWGDSRIEEVFRSFLILSGCHSFVNSVSYSPEDSPFDELPNDEGVKRYFRPSLGLLLDHFPFQSFLDFVDRCRSNTHRKLSITPLMIGTIWRFDLLIRNYSADSTQLTKVIPSAVVNTFHNLKVILLHNREDITN